MIAAVAILASFVQVVTRSIRLPTIVAMVLDGFVKSMVGFRKPLLAVIGTRTWGTSEQHESS
jgi:hypothetical protein